MRAREADHDGVLLALDDLTFVAGGGRLDDGAVVAQQRGAGVVPERGQKRRAVGERYEQQRHRAVGRAHRPDGEVGAAEGVGEHVQGGGLSGHQ